MLAALSLNAGGCAHLVFDVLDPGGVFDREAIPPAPDYACCAVWAPRYRLVNGKAFTEPSDVGQLAIDVAYGDLGRAFAWFLSQRPAGRPLILASHSQGSAHLRENAQTRLAALLRARSQRGVDGGPHSPPDGGSLGR